METGAWQLEAKDWRWWGGARHSRLDAGGWKCDPGGWRLGDWKLQAAEFLVFRMLHASLVHHPKPYLYFAEAGCRHRIP